MQPKLTSSPQIIAALIALVGEYRQTECGEPCIITYALGCNGVPRRVAKAQLQTSMMFAVIAAWRKAHKLRLFKRYYFFPPKRLVWRQGPDLYPDPKIKGGYILTLRIGFEG